MMIDAKSITWRELQGNKYRRGLHPAMVENKYCKLEFTTLHKGKDKSYFQVEYDREYVLNYLSKKVCKPFGSLRLETLLDLIKEAYIRCQKETHEK